MSREWVPSAVYVHKKTTQNSIANKSKQDTKTERQKNLLICLSSRINQNKIHSLSERSFNNYVKKIEL